MKVILYRGSSYDPQAFSDGFDSNLGCNICPCCSTVYSPSDPSHDKITRKPTYFAKSNGLFKKPSIMRTDKYHCANCNTIWESESYEIKEQVIQYE